MRSPALDPTPASKERSEQRRSSGSRQVVGRPFQPGTSGNPGGRPKGFASRIREATREGSDLVAFALSVLQGRIPGVRIEHRLEALHWLADRGWGKPALSVELRGDHELLPPAVALNILQVLGDPVQAARLETVTIQAIQQAQTIAASAPRPALPTAR
jgi:uncharacterized protein DUF5681